MAPAQIMDIPQTPTKYTHKKFQGQQKRYAHKKFGTRMTQHKSDEELDITKNIFINKANENMDHMETIIQTKRTTGDIFRPYALPEDAPRKRKHHEIQDVAEEQHLPTTTTTTTQSMDFKRFAPSPIASSQFLPNYQHFNNPLPVPMQQSYYRFQHYQFDAQTFALVLQKQQAALCMGAMLKRQANLNLYNIMGQ